MSEVKYVLQRPWENHLHKPSRFWQFQRAKWSCPSWWRRTRNRSWVASSKARDGQSRLTNQSDWHQPWWKAHSHRGFQRIHSNLRFGKWRRNQVDPGSWLRGSLPWLLSLHFSLKSLHFGKWVLRQSDSYLLLWTWLWQCDHIRRPHSQHCRFEVLLRLQRKRRIQTAQNNFIGRRQSDHLLKLRRNNQWTISLSQGSVQEQQDSLNGCSGH